MAVEQPHGQTQSANTDTLPAFKGCISLQLVSQYSMCNINQWCHGKGKEGNCLPLNFGLPENGQKMFCLSENCYPKMQNVGPKTALWENLGA